MIRTSDVSKILSNKRSLPKPYSIKLDMPPEHRRIGALLLRERWKLIQSGVPRNEIRIKNHCLLVGGEMYGQVEDSEFQLSQSTTVVTVPGPVEVVDTSVTSVNQLSNTSNDAHKLTSKVAVVENSLHQSVSPSYSPPASPLTPYLKQHKQLLH